MCDDETFSGGECGGGAVFIIVGTDVGVLKTCFKIRVGDVVKLVLELVGVGVGVVSAIVGVVGAVGARGVDAVIVVMEVGDVEVFVCG